MSKKKYPFGSINPTPSAFIRSLASMALSYVTQVLRHLSVVPVAPLAADLTNEDICQLGEWAIQEQYEDSFRKYITLDEYGQNAVDAIIRSEFARCQEQGGLKSTKGISVAVKIRDVK